MKRVLETGLNTTANADSNGPSRDEWLNGSGAGDADEASNEQDAGGSKEEISAAEDELNNGATVH